MDQTVRAGANVVGGEKDVLGGVADEEEVGRLDRWTAMMGMGRALVNVAQNKSEGPSIKRKKRYLENRLFQCKHIGTFCHHYAEDVRIQSYHFSRQNQTYRGRDTADWIVLSTEDHRACWDLLRGRTRWKAGRCPGSRHSIWSWC